MREGTPPVADAIDAFLTDLELAGRSPRAIAPYRSYLKPLLAHENVAQITDGDLRALVLERLRKNQRTAFALHAVLSSFYNYGERMGWGPNPMRSIPRPAPKPPDHRYLSRAEISRVYAACSSDELRLIVRLLLTGMRAGELLGVTWADLDADAGQLRLLRTKGGRPRRVWLDADTVAFLQERAVGRDAGAIIGGTYSSLHERLRRLSVRSGIPFTAHTFRRTFASWALIEGMNQETVKQLAGWSNDSMLRHYAKSALQDAAVRDSERFDLTSRLLK